MRITAVYRNPKHEDSPELRAEVLRHERMSPRGVNHLFFGDWNAEPDVSREGVLLAECGYGICAAGDSDGVVLPTRWGGHRAIDWG